MPIIDVEQTTPRWSWDQIESALLKVPDDVLLAAGKCGCTDEDGCRQARARLCDHVRRRLATEGPE